MAWPARTTWQGHNESPEQLRPEECASIGAEARISRASLGQAEKVIVDLDELLHELEFTITTLDRALSVPADGTNMTQSSSEMVDDLTKKLSETLNGHVTEEEQSPSPFGPCQSCGKIIQTEACLVNKKHFHPDCFTCSECKRPLGTDKFFMVEGQSFCLQHKDKFLEKCTKCKALIEGETMRIKDSGQPFHPDCFVCIKCDLVIQGRYFNSAKGPLCMEDYVASRPKCFRCSDPILTGVVKALDNEYHPNCFTCTYCPKILDGETFFVTGDNQPMCRQDYTKYLAKPCHQCHEKILDEVFVNVNGEHYYHKQCYQSKEDDPSGDQPL